MFDLFDTVPEAMPIFAAAGALIGEDSRAFLASATDAALHANRTSQLLCVARALMAAASLELPSSFLVAGYSVGEMAAWGVAGFWSFRETLHLTATRAELMDAAGGEDDALGFVRGLAHAHVLRLVDQFHCAIAILNPGQLFIIGGARKQISLCCDAALAEGAVAARPIAVNVASHTPQLADAVDPFLAALKATPLSRPSQGISFIGVAGAAVISGADDLAGLAGQIATTIDWATTLEALIERGVDRVLELGPGKALAEMARTAYPALNARAVDDFHSLSGVDAWIASDRR
jgi:[acyl-carrier-protein] S-malonyltransferase